MTAKLHKLHDITAGFCLKLKKIIFGIVVLVLSQTSMCLAQEETISDEDIEVIQMLEMLEHLDLLEEDLELLENMSEIGEEDES